MREFETIRRLDYLVPAKAANPDLSFDHLFSGGHGNMFGVLECRDAAGAPVVLRAFSSLRRGIRDVAGWVPPILSAEVFYGIVLPGQQRIEQLTAELEGPAPSPTEADSLRRERKRISQDLLAQMQRQYRFRNFRGQSRALHDVFLGSGGMPGGVGECCAPKLLQHAALLGLRPIGVAEFYWGGELGSRRMKQAEFHPSCSSRCQPILGFMLCGLEDRTCEPRSNA